MCTLPPSNKSWPKPLAKLALYFAEDTSPRIIDTDGHADAFVWRVGRNPKLEIVFRNPRVSREHASIRYDEELGCWQIADSKSANGTWLNGRKLPPYTWHPIVESDRAIFGVTSAAISFSYDTHSTLDGSEDDTPTGGQPKPQEHPAVPPAPIDDWRIAIIQAIKETPNHRLVLYGILALSGLALWLLLTGWV